MTAARLSARSLTVQLKLRTVLDDVSFDIVTPGLVVLAGPNGAGKSTLLRALAGLVAPAAGEVRIDDGALATWSIPERARRIGYLPQERTVHWPLAVRSVVALGRLPHQGPRARESNADRTAIDFAMAAMDITALAARSVQDLSGGERARVLVARVLAQEPQILLADEPTAGLDPSHQWALFETLEAAAQSGMRVVVALHDLAIASRFATHLVLLAGGRLIASGPPSGVLTPERLAQVYGITADTVETGGHRLIVPTGRTPTAAARDVPVP